MISALKEIRRIVAANRILLKPSFQDFDKAKCCHVTTQQFGRVLKKLGLIPTSDQVFDLISRKYFDKGNTKEINYFSFCHDVDKPEDMFPGYVAPIVLYAQPV
jgi:Ca2+-binding EF-hand superfamily protein